jgi:hypothetical protein
MQESLRIFSELKQGKCEYDYYELACLLLPQLEHSLRRIFVAVHALPETFIQAVSRLHYTTLDLFLSRDVELEAQPVIPNILHEEVSPQVMECLLDMFVHPAGPRLRDKIAHAEVDPTSVGEVLVDRIMGLVLYLTMRYRPRFRPLQFETVGENIDRCIGFFAGYFSCFHPKSLLCRELVVYHGHFLEFLQLEGTFREETSEEEWIYQKRNDYVSDEEFSAEMNTSIVNLITGDYGRAPIFAATNDQREMRFNGREILGALNTLYRPSPELSKVLLLRKIAKLVSELTRKLISKVVDLRQLVIAGKATKRLEESLYKLMGCIG